MAATPSSASAAAPSPREIGRNETSAGEAPPVSPTRRRRHGTHSPRRAVALSTTNVTDAIHDFVKKPDKHAGARAAEDEDARGVVS